MLMPGDPNSCVLLNTPKRREILRQGPAQFAKCDILGRGSFGTVFKAVYKAQQVAVKVVSNLNDTSLQTVQNEAHILGWRHKNIVRILEVESTPYCGIVIMEQFCGQCLQAVLDRVELSLMHRNYISLDILCALTYCHRRHLLHLDVKPQNILLDFTACHPIRYETSRAATAKRKYICKLCDFGSSMKVDSDDHSIAAAATKGTVRYMSPEALREQRLTPATDIYSLGITMWQLKYRQIPYAWIGNNDVVVYQVVKMHLRPDSNDTPWKAASIPSIAVHHVHDDCLCEHFSSEISYRPLEQIKCFLSQGDGNGSVVASVVDIVKRDPFRELFSPQLSDVAVHNTRRKHLKHNSTVDFKLELIFRDSMRTQDSTKEMIFASIYRSCWHTDPNSRPGSNELRTKLVNLLRKHCDTA